MSCSRGCCGSQREHYRSVRFGATRGAAVEVERTERRWDRDMAAYKAMRRDGLQPAGIDGAADLQARASTEFEVSSGRLLPGRVAKRVEQMLDGASDG